MVDTGNRKGAAIFRYGQRIQGILGEQLKAEPWMHIGILTMKDGRVLYGVYIWDTRKVLTQGTMSEGQLERIYKTKPTYATDNHELLKGRGEFVDEFNGMFGYTQAYKQRKRDAAKARREANLREVPKTYAPYRISDD